MSSPPETTKRPLSMKSCCLRRARTQEPKSSYRVQRRVWLPLILFLLTMLSTFVAGATGWMPHGYWIFSEERIAAINFRLAILQHWETA